jgi:hypothetical protein
VDVRDGDAACGVRQEVLRDAKALEIPADDIVGEDIVSTGAAMLARAHKCGAHARQEPWDFNIDAPDATAGVSAMSASTTSATTAATTSAGAAAQDA